MGKRLLILACAGLLTSVATAAAAHGGGGGMPGGVSGAHMSASGLSNTNGPAALDRDKGRDRAEDRMSSSGAAHGQAQQAKHGKSRRPEDRAGALVR